MKMNKGKKEGKVSKELMIGEFHPADLNAPFKYFRNILAPIEFAILFRFMELLIEERVKGNERPMAEFNENVVSLSGNKSEHMYIKALNNRKSFRNVFQQLNEDFKEKRILENSGQVPDSLKPSAAYIKSLANCFKNSKTSNAFYEIVKGKDTKSLNKFFNVPIQLIRIADYTVLEKHEPNSCPFSINPIIYLSVIKEGEYKLFYDKKESSPIKKPNKNFIILPCLHRWDLTKHTTAALTLKFDHPEAKLVLKCPEPFCFEILDTNMAKKALGTEYDKFFKVSDKLDKTACIIDGTITESNIKMDNKHYMCIKCMNMYLSIKRHLDSSHKAIPINCPVKDCNAKILPKQYFLALDKEEMKAIANALRGPEEEKGKEKRICVCSYCLKTASNSDIKHNCGSYSHTSCLKKFVCERSAICASYEILCKSCGFPFCSKTIEGLFGAGDPVSITLKRNLKEKAISLRCEACKSIPKETCTTNFITCTCKKKYCRLCGSIAEAHNCYPRHGRINQLAVNNTEVKDVLPCPNCKQLNLLFVQELVTICVNCKCTFCGECGADQKVINYHGSEYHRPNCSRAKGSVKAKLLCSLCEKGKKCKKPKNLEDGELPAEEFFS